MVLPVPHRAAPPNRRPPPPFGFFTGYIVTDAGPVRNVDEQGLRQLFELGETPPCKNEN